MKITMDEWLAELRKYKMRPDDVGLTAHEIADKMGRSVEWVRRGLLRDGIKEGKIVAGVRNATDIRGKPFLTPVYRLVRKGK